MLKIDYTYVIFQCATDVETNFQQAGDDSHIHENICKAEGYLETNYLENKYTMIYKRNKVMCG